MMKGFLFAVGYLLCLSEVNVKAIPSIWIGPGDNIKILRPGSINGVDVFLECILLNLNSAYMVSWKKNGIVISDGLNMRQNLDHLVDTARYSVIQSTVGTQYALEISQITETTYRKDSGEYQCIVIDVNNSQNVTQSRIATVVIYDTVACLLNDTFYLNSQFVSAGSITKVTCRTYSLSNPQVSITLFMQSNNLSSSLSFRLNGQILDAVYAWEPSKDANVISITCVSNHPSFHSTKSCTMGPFTVQYKPDVTITPTSYTITSTLDSQVFTCNADANPSVEVDEYVWKFDGVSIHPSSRFIYGSDHRNLLIRIMSPADNGMHTLTCETTNAIGTGFHNISVTIDIHEHTSTTAADTNKISSGKVTSGAVTSFYGSRDLDSSLFDTGATLTPKRRITREETFTDDIHITSTHTQNTSFYSPGSKFAFDDDDNDIIITAGGVGIVIGIVLTLTVAGPLIMFALKLYLKKLKTSQEAMIGSHEKELQSIKHMDDGQVSDTVVDFELTNRTEQRTAEDTGVSIDELPIALDAGSVTVESGSSYANVPVIIDEEQNGHYQSLTGQSDNVYSSLVK